MRLYRGTRWRALLLFAVVWAFLTYCTEANAHTAMPRRVAEIEWHVIEPCPDFPEAGGCAYPPGPWNGDTVSIYLAAGFDWHTVLHELGHAYDYRSFDDAERGRFKAIMGYPERDWRDAPNAPAEQFAEAYAHCGLHFHWWRDEGYTTYDYLPTYQQYRAACRLIWESA